MLGWKAHDWQRARASLGLLHGNSKSATAYKHMVCTSDFPRHKLRCWQLSSAWQPSAVSCGSNCFPPPAWSSSSHKGLSPVWGCCLSTGGQENTATTCRKYTAQSYTPRLCSAAYSRLWHTITWPRVSAIKKEGSHKLKIVSINTMNTSGILLEDGATSSYHPMRLPECSLDYRFPWGLPYRASENL